MKQELKLTGSKPKTHWQTWSYFTGHKLGDLALGLLAGAAAHFVFWLAFLLAVGLAFVAYAHPSPGPVSNVLWYGSWVFSVAVAVFCICWFFRRYPALMNGFAIGTVPAAAINLFLIWFGSGLAGGAAS